MRRREEEEEEEGADSDGDLGRYEGKGQWVLKNMKDKDGKQDGVWGKRGKRGEQ